MAEKSRPRPALSAAATNRPSEQATAGATADRRKRIALRRLIDEMLAEIRAAANAENWTGAARAQAESDLARIMDQVKREAMRAEPKSKAKRAKPR